jgi:uncharacterized protein (TIGR03437 family)
MMRIAGLLAAAATVVSCLAQMPSYTADSIVNLASGTPGALAPNALASIRGSRLSFVDKAITAADISAGELPIVLPGTGVRVLVGGLPGHIYLASSEQINFLVPCNLRSGQVTVQVVRDGAAGPAVRVTLGEAAPAMFQVDESSVLASHLDYSLVSEQSPAAPGEWVILWATGLGAVTPPATYGMLAPQAAPLQQMGAFRALLDGVAVAPGRVGYAGLAPGWAGLYQINLKLPESTGPNPEIRVAVGEAISPPGLRLWVKRQEPSLDSPATH